MIVKFSTIFRSWSFWLIGGALAIYFLSIEPQKFDIIELVVSILTSYIFLLMIAVLGWILYWPARKKEKE